MNMNQLQIQRVLTCVFFLVFAVEGFAGTSMPTKTSASSTRQQRSYLQMYVPKQSSSQSPPKVAQHMIPNPTSIAPTTRGTEKQETPRRRYNTELSNSVLAECNTLPRFQTAHGLLSPETVMRMEEMVELDGHSSVAVNQFLTRYRRSGPMSCLSMLSDPDVLPHLTKAMRDVV